MQKVKKHDFIEVDYIGRIKASNQIFDLTNEELAKENKLYHKNTRYGPVVICIGEAHILKELDLNLEGKEIGKEYTIEIPSEKAFGKKDPRLMRIVNSNIFKKQEIMPIPGLQVSIDGLMGVIRSVSGGRCIVDFNHPLAGRDLVYEIKINKIIEDIEEKIKCLINFNLLLDEKDFSIEIIENKAKISLKKDLPEELQNILKEKIKELVKDIKDIEIIKEI